MDDQLLTINALAELERVGLDFEVCGDDEVKVRCPFHDDKTPSCAVNVKKNVFKCHASGCSADGDIVTLLAKVLKTTRRVMWEDLSTRYDFDEARTVSSAAVERWHEAVWSAKPLLKELYARGVTDEMIRARRIGYDGHRLTIPIYNAQGLIVNVRQYLPGAPGPEKIRNKRGCGKIRLYPIEQLKYDVLVVCGGEMKAIVTASLLNAHDIGAITATAGEGNWDVSFNKEFVGKRVYVMYDVDKEGVSGANSLCARLKRDVTWIGRVDLPLNVEQYPHGDVNDYVGQEHKTDVDLLTLLQDVAEWEPTAQGASTDDAITELHVSDASKAQYTGKRIRVKGNVAAIDTAPYIIPKRIVTRCERNQEWCSQCPVFLERADDSGAVTMLLPAESPAILDMVAMPKKVQRDALIEGLRMPPCKIVEFNVAEYYNVEDIRLSPQLEISSRSIDDVLQPALYVGHGLESNESYAFTGRMFPHPKTQQSMLLISEAEPTRDALSTYAPTLDDLEYLRMFQPSTWTVDGLRDKLRDIYADLAANITHIYDRSQLHFVIDLAYHSALLFNFDGKQTKGWVEVLVVGDSSQGKSETILRMMQHYGLGERVECKNATVAGLLGGLQQMGTRWFVTWGVIPSHDRRLVILEELKGTSTDVIGKLTDMRSSGIAEIPKIEKRRTHARTRLIMISNPRSDRQMAMYNFGVEVVKELIGGLEDVRRFDTVLLVSASQIASERLNQLQTYRPKVAHVYDAHACRDLVLWAWTRTADQVTFTDEAVSRVMSEATRLCAKFTEAVPIVDRGSMRFKLARLAIALACRTFSNDDVRVLVRDCHVEYIAKYLEETYDDQVFGYRDFSDAIAVNETLLSVDILKKAVLQTPFPGDMVKQLLYTNDIELRDICDWCGWDRNESMQLLSLLVRKHALLRDGFGYRKTPAFIGFLKELLVSTELRDKDRPSYVEEF